MNVHHNEPQQSSDAPVFVLTIGRQVGSGAREIAQALAERLGIALYDKEVLSMAAQETGLGKDFFERNDEKKSFFRNLIHIVEPFVSGGGDFYSHQLSNENLFELQSRVIQRVASERSCIFIGRAADYILRNHPRHVSIFIAADLKTRIKRIAEEQQLTPKRALELIEDKEEQRSSYYDFYASGTWGAADTYDLCINSTVLGIEQTIDFIEHFVRTKLNLIAEK